ncbi:MAG: hypothetical protein C5B56_08605 [Proteobacteria bacterium]|nr:MAG: hypothetical protein C5B56_08605 [Pseudomonadota bacterium]
MRRKPRPLPSSRFLCSPVARASAIDRLHPVLVTDDIHAWVGQEVVARAQAPMSVAALRRLDWKFAWKVVINEAAAPP